MTPMERFACWLLGSLIATLILLAGLAVSSNQLEPEPMEDEDMIVECPMCGEAAPLAETPEEAPAADGWLFLEDEESARLAFCSARCLLEWCEARIAAAEEER